MYASERPESASSGNRVIDVINYLAAHPTEAFTLSELARALDLSHGSAHRVLTTLTEARWLSRNHRHKTYSLGLAMVAIGQASLEKHRAIEIARREMARLVPDVPAMCLASAIIDDQLLILAKAGSPRSHEPMAYVGERRPFLPPVGLAHIAWSNQEVIDTFLNKAPQDMDAAARAHLAHAVDLVRQRGYAIAGNGPGLHRLGMTGLSLPEIQLARLEDGVTCGVGYISAPVFAPDGSVALELTLSGMAQTLTAEEIAAMAERLRTAALVVTRETHGRIPPGIAGL